MGGAGGAFGREAAGLGVDFAVDRVALFLVRALVFFGAGADFLVFLRGAAFRAVFRARAAFLAGFFAAALRDPARAPRRAAFFTVFFFFLATVILLSSGRAGGPIIQLAPCRIEATSAS